MPVSIHQEHPKSILFYDGSCGLCRKEILLLEQRLNGKIQLQDISESQFHSFKGIDASDMMLTLHLWDGERFITGLDASLYYWSLAGLNTLVFFLRLPGCYQSAKLGYALWRRFRPKQKHCQLN